MSPVFMTQNLTDTGYGKCVGADEAHLKCQVKQKGKRAVFDMIGFGLGEKLETISERKLLKRCIL